MHGTIKVELNDVLDHVLTCSNKDYLISLFGLVRECLQNLGVMPQMSGAYESRPATPARVLDGNEVSGFIRGCKDADTLNHIGSDIAYCLKGHGVQVAALGKPAPLTAAGMKALCPEPAPLAATHEGEVKSIAVPPLSEMPAPHTPTPPDHQPKHPGAMPDYSKFPEPIARKMEESWKKQHGEPKP